jgi:hypothetical protein
VGFDEGRIVGGLVVVKSLLDVGLVEVDDVVLDTSSRNGVVEECRVGAERLKVRVGKKGSLDFGGVGVVDGTKEGVGSHGLRLVVVCRWLSVFGDVVGCRDHGAFGVAKSGEGVGGAVVRFAHCEVGAKCLSWKVFVVETKWVGCRVGRLSRRRWSSLECQRPVCRKCSHPAHDRTTNVR